MLRRRSPQPAGFAAAFSLIVGAAIVVTATLCLRLAALGEIPQGATLGPDDQLRGTLFDDYAIYKLAETVHRAPEIVVLGSSRVMQIRGAMFLCPRGDECFYNAGGALPSLQAGIAFLRALPAAPHVVLLGLDLWHFNPAFDPGKHDAVVLEPSASSTLDASLAIARKVAQLAVADPQVRDALVRGGGSGTRGLTAIVRGSGFRRDGSYEYGPQVRAQTSGRAPDERAAELIARVPAGCCRFERFDHADPASIAELDELLRLCAERGIAVIGFTPPYADAVGAALSADTTDRLGVEDVRRKVTDEFAKRDQPLLWSPWMGPAGCGAEETWDGSHPSEVCSARVLLALLSDPGAARILAGHAAPASLERLIAARASALSLTTP